MIAISFILILTLFTSGGLSHDHEPLPLWPFFDYFGYYNMGAKRFERGPPEWARGHGNKKNNHGHGHGPPFGHGPPGHNHGHGHGHGHSHYNPDDDDSISEEYFDYGPTTTTQRPPTPLPTIATTTTTSTDYSGLIDIRFKPVDERNKRSKGTDPSTEIQDIPQVLQERNSLRFYPSIVNDKPYYPFYPPPPRLSTCIKKFECVPMHECKNPPRSRSHYYPIAFCKWVDDEPYICCDKSKTKPSSLLKCASKNVDHSHEALIGGTPVEEGTAYPWMVAVGEMTRNGTVDWYCGGALIGDSTVITAAHCVSRRNASIIRIGETDLSIDINDTSASAESNIQEISVCRTLIHPLYRSPLLYNDIALLYLDEPVDVSPYASPICLPQKFSITDTPVALLTGWGQLTFATERTDKLQEVTLKIFNNTYCDEQYALTQASKRFFPRGILDSQLCAGDESGGKDACQGDSGAPLVTNQDGNFILIGTVSAGIGCGSQTFPGVYTRISSFTPWIYDNII